MILGHNLRIVGGKKMKLTLKIFLTCFIIAAAGIVSASTGLTEPVTAPVDTALTSDELIELASQAHKSTVQIFSDAFEAELFYDQKPDWQEIRPQLTTYWSAKILDSDLKEFYHDHLHEWGYEMGFAFPLWQPQAIESVTIVSSKAQEIIAEFKAPTNYNTIETITTRFIKADRSWIVDSTLFTKVGPSR